MTRGGRRGRKRTAGDNVEACFASGDGNPNNGGDFELSGGFRHGGAAEPPLCPGDLDGDGDTDQSDLGILLADWGCDDPVNGCAGDLNGDDKTDQADLGILLADWGCGVGP